MGKTKLAVLGDLIALARELGLVVIEYSNRFGGGQLGIDHSVVRRALDALVRDGLIERLPRPENPFEDYDKPEPTAVRRALASAEAPPGYANPFDAARRLDRYLLRCFLALAGFSVPDLPGSIETRAGISGLDPQRAARIELAPALELGTPLVGEPHVLVAVVELRDVGGLATAVDAAALCVRHVAPSFRSEAGS